LLGEHDTLEALRATLPHILASRVVHTGPYSWARQAPKLDEKVQEVLDAALRAHDARLLEDFERLMREHHFVVAGPQEVIDALRNGQVGYPGYLLLEPDRGQMAARCTRCESLFTTIYATCPVCQGACEKVNLWQELLLFAARHNITAHTVESHPALSRHGGVAAVLSRSAAWEPAAAAVVPKPGGGSS
jgi:RNA polymerase subunit RPABC4/transcription elongation factor Spt4